jgi:retinol dehydrogenase 14
MGIEGPKAIAQLRTRDMPMEWSMRGKTALFTGASRGMGHLAAIELARLGAEIIVVGHNDARGDAAVDAIRATGSAAEFVHADMGDAEEVCALAETVLARHRKIDVLIHSAAGMPPSTARTREGVDRGFAQNFLGGFLLTRLLEERLLASAPARVIAVGSSAHRFVKKLDLDEFMHPVDAHVSSFRKGNYQMHSYQVAKLAVTTWIYGLARRWASDGITANVLDPGLVKGDFGEHFEGPAPIRLMMNQVFPFFLAVGQERGSEQYVRLAADPTLERVTSMYFVSGREKKEGGSALSRDPEIQKRIDDAANEWAMPFLSGDPLRASTVSA